MAKKAFGTGKKANPFGGKETFGEEMAEAKSLKGGKISEKQYIKGEKREGHGGATAGLRAKAIKKGKLSPEKYATAKFARGGGVTNEKPEPKKKDTTKFPDRPDDKHFPDQEKTISPPAEATKRLARGGGVELRGKTRGGIR